MEKKKRFLISTAYYLGIAAVIFIGLKYALGAVMPFVIGFGIAALLNPLVRFLCAKYKMKYKGAALFVLFSAYATVGTLLVSMILRLTVMAGDFSKRLPELYKSAVEPAIGRAYEWISQIAARFIPESQSEVVGGIGVVFDSLSSSLAAAASNVSVRVLSFLSDVATAVPGALVSLGFTVISSFFFIVDFEKIVSTIKSLLPQRAVGFMKDVKSKFFSTIVKYLRSYALIMLITFAQLFLGLSLIGTQNAVLLALITALLDVLPVIGTGLVLLPWAIISLLGKRVGYGVGLIIIWTVITVVRNIIEPKIVGKQFGLHPLVTLIAMFVGTKLFGFVGLILLPVGISITVSLVGRENHSSVE